ncbi:sine oculis-binding protein homolog [Asterias rubens]|uniref:sine oculis-binding protein homolog n=1 Tax=Asterias rubens TaxID=7604 RepID=UPI0014555499|nr:sine oculis-binding protein homolog [Asterias rubens]
MEPQNISEDSGEKILVKTEPQEDMKDYAEDTMNELLAIYGYEKVDEGMTRELHLNHFKEDEAQERETKSETPDDVISIKQEADDGLNDIKPPPGCSNNQYSGPNSPTLDDHSNNSGTAVSTSWECSDGENTASEFEIVCAWCQHFGFKRYTLNTATESKAFCSEKCFAACRRAYFKRSKMCYWCRHIRHTKEYIDFQDGERKLQFCSEKCLNQYKMDAFCHETHVLGSSSMESSSGADPGGSEQGGAAAGNSSDEIERGAERGEGNMLLSVAVDSSPQSHSLGNGLQPAAAGSEKQLPMAFIQTTKSKQHSNRTIIGVQHVAIAPKVTSASPRQKGGTLTATSPNAFSSRVSPSNPPAGQVYGLQTMFQPGVGNSQLVARPPVVVRGTHWPPVVRQVPGYAIPRQQHPVSQVPQLGLPVTSPSYVKPSASTTSSSVFPQKLPDLNSYESSQPPRASSSHLLPPVTVMVPQPIFIPVPFPIPIPIPVPVDKFHAMRAAMAAGRRSPNKANSSTCTSPGFEENTASSSSTQTPGVTSSSLDFSRYPHTLFNESLLHKQAEPNLLSTTTGSKHFQGLLQQGDSMNYARTNEPSSYTDRRHKAWQPLFKYKMLQRSASMDLSLARPSEESTSKSVHRVPRMERDPDCHSQSSNNISTHRESSLRSDEHTHLSGESSAKVREALRCHLTKRLSQSALNLTEVGRAPSLQDDLRRCQSLSRLRYTEPNHMDKLPELTDGYSSPSYCSSTSSNTQRSCRNQAGKEEGYEDEQPSPQTGESHALVIESEDEDSKEPESKRQCLNHI